MKINPIPTGRTAKTDANGVLDTLVKQPYDNQPTEDQGGCHLEESFKGPYSKLKEILSHINVGMPIETVYATLRSYVGIQQAYEYPACPARDNKTQYWVCVGIRVEEAEAGDHGFLYVSYDGSLSIESGEDEVFDPYQDVWSVSWQSYSVDPYNFLANEPHEPYPCSPSFDVDPVDFPPQYWEQLGQRQPIDKFLTNSGAGKAVNGVDYKYYVPDAQFPDSRYFLNGAEAAVAAKKQLGRSATYHYPIIVHQTVAKTELGRDLSGVVGGGLDVALTAVPAGCPYDFDPMWKYFVKIGDDLSQAKSRQGFTTYTRRETFAGFTNVDMNFYGPRQSTFSHDQQTILNGRWELEKL